MSTIGDISDRTKWLVSKRYVQALLIIAVMLVGVVTVFNINPSHEAASTTLSQCVNGGIHTNSVALTQCTGTDWVSGNANGQKAHWKEGQFIAYRATIGSIAAGSHTLVFTYDTVHSGGHALDYIGSVNATETFSTTSTTLNFNNNNPCIDFAPTFCTSTTAGFDSAASPVASIAAPLENFGPGTGGEQGCGGSLGVFFGSQIRGKIQLWGPAGSSFTSATITSDNVVSGTGQCTTTVSVAFTLGGSGSSNIVLAWGGHIASQLNWGFGNGASSVSGSPYHMSLVSLDGASTGSQDRALATSAIFFTPIISTAIFNAATNTPLCATNTQGNWTACTPTVTVGTTVYDNATFALGSISSVATGSVTFQLWTGGTCSGTKLAATTVSVSGGRITGRSSPFTTTTAGTYSFNATYTGDSSDFKATSACEPLIVGKAQPKIVTSVTSPITIGGSTTDTATISGLVNPTGAGTITFTVYSDAACTALVTTLGSTPASVTANGNYVSGSFKPANAGTYYWIASFNGDNNNNAVSTKCGDSGETLVVGPATPIIVTVVSTPITVGGSTTDTATISGLVNPTGTGTISFTAYSDVACTVSVFTSGSTPSSVNANGNYVSGSFKPANAGTYYWIASFSGDNNNKAATTKCGDSGETLVVNPATPKITTSVSTPIFVGGSTTDTATISGLVNPTGTGTITFTVYSNAACTALVTTLGSTPSMVTANGNYVSGSFTFNTAGTYYWIASFNGDHNNNGATTKCGDAGETLVVNPVTPGIVTSVGTPIIVGGSTTDTATISGLVNPTGTGTVTFTVYSDPACTVTVMTLGATPSSVTANGNYVSGSFTPANAGTYYWIASFSGDHNNNAATTKCGDSGETLVVNPATPAIVTQVTTPITVGGSTTDTATISGLVNPTGTGTVTFTVYSDVACTVLVTTLGSTPPSVTANGNYVSGSFTPANAGTYYWIASYSGDHNNNGATTKCGDSGETLVVNPATPTITTSVSTPIFVGGSTMDTATIAGLVNPTGTGTVTFTVYSDVACTVTVATLGSTPSSVTANGNYVSGSFTPASAGTYYWIASYSGDHNNNGATTKCGDAGETLVVSPVTPSIVTSVGTPITVGGSTTDTATISGLVNPTGTGTVTFTVYSDVACTALVTTLGSTPTLVTANGNYVSGSFTPTSAGTYYWIASYSGDHNNNAATTKCGDAGETLVVNPATPAIVTQVTTPITVGGSTTDTATISGLVNPTGTGTVTFTVYSDAACTALVTTLGSTPSSVTANGNYVSGSFTPANAGTYYWIASFNGDHNNNAATTHCGDSGETLVVVPASPTITTLVATPITVGGSTTDTATINGLVNPTGTGTVTFTVYSDAACTALVTTLGSTPSSVTMNGNYVSASFTFNTAGTYYWIASFSGDHNNNVATTKCGDSGETLVVNPATPAIVTLVTTPITVGGSTTDTATISGLVNPTGAGTITFTVYSDASCTALVTTLGSTPSMVTANGNYVSGSFTFNTAGTYYWIASFNGDHNNNAATSKCGDSGETLVVNPATPSITTSVAPSVITFGQSSTDTATIVGLVNPTGTGTITFTVYSDAACTNSVFTSVSTPTTVTANGNYVSNAFKPSSTGTYYWIASFNGDHNNNAASTKCGDGGETLVVSSIPKVTAFGYTNSPTNNDPTLGSGMVTYSFTIHNYGTSPVTLSGSLTFTGSTASVTGCTGNGLSFSGVALAAGADATFSVTCSYSGNSGDTVQATLNAMFTDINSVTGPVSGSPATITFTVQKT